MHLVFDIFQGLGVSAAVGIRPIFPTVAVGALAAGDVEIHFAHTSYSFLQRAPFLLAFGLVGVGALLLDLRLGRESSMRRPLEIVLAAAALAAAALLFAASLTRDHHPAWPGWIGGVACATLAIAATWPLLGRVRGRLASGAGDAVPFYAELAATVVATLSVLAPPLGVLAILLLLWLLAGARRREGEKFAGLRILR